MLSILELFVEMCMEVWYDLKNSTICGSAVLHKLLLKLDHIVGRNIGSRYYFQNTKNR